MRAVPRSRRTMVVLLGLFVLLGVAGVGVAATVKPDFALQVSPASQSVQQGQAGAFSVTTTGSNGFAGTVTYSVTGLPSGATPTFSPSTTTLSKTVASTTTGLSIATTKATPVGTYALTITGTSGSTKRSVAAKLTLTYALNGSFTLSASPSSVVVAPGATGVYTVNVAWTGAAAPVTLAPYGSWPAGVTPTFSPNPVPGAGTSTLSVTTAATTSLGTYTLYLVGSATVDGRTTYQYAQAQLVVENANTSFGISAAAPRGLAPGVPPQPMDLALSNPNKQDIAVTNLTVQVTGTNRAGCAVDDFAVTQYSGPYPLTVPAAGTRTLTQLGVSPDRHPQLVMVNKPTNQDACKGATLTLSFSGSGQGT